MKPSKNCIDLIKRFEGCNLNAYRCPAGVATIGWGSTIDAYGNPVKMGTKITQIEADTLLINDVTNFAKSVTILISDINQNQFDSLVSFAYNVGAQALKTSRLLELIKAKAPAAEITKQFMNWVKAKKFVLNGLINRRKAEAELFNKI